MSKTVQRTDAPVNYWLLDAAKPLVYGDDEWRMVAFTGLQARGEVSDLVESVSWEDTGAILTGSLNLRRPQDGGAAFIDEGTLVRLDHRRSGTTGWREVWSMRTGAVLESDTVQINPRDGTYTYALSDDLAILKQSDKVTFKVKKDKAHPKGWLVHDAIRAFCRQESIPLGKLPRTRHRIKKFSKTANPLDILAALIKLENDSEAREYRIRYSSSKLQFVPLQRSPYLLHMRDTIIDASLSQGRRADFATVLKVTSTKAATKGTQGGQKRKSRKKIATTVSSPRYVARFGTITKTLKVSADSVAEARARGKLSLARRSLPKQEVSFTHQGMPFLRRQAALMLHFREQNFRELVYVTGVSHSLDASDYTMEVSVAFKDPFDTAKERKLYRKCEKARKRGRKLPKDCPAVAERARIAAQTKKARQRT